MTFFDPCHDLLGHMATQVAEDCHGTDEYGMHHPWYGSAKYILQCFVSLVFQCKLNSCSVLGLECFSVTEYRTKEEGSKSLCSKYSSAVEGLVEYFCYSESKVLFF